MRTSRAPLCIMAVVTVFLTTAQCPAQRKAAAADKAADKECIALIGEYYDAAYKQDHKRLIGISAGNGTWRGLESSAHAKVFQKTISQPLKAKFIKISEGLRLYKVTIVTKGDSGTKSSQKIVILKMIEGQRKIVGVVPPKEWKLKINPADFKDIHRYSLKDAAWSYQSYIYDANYLKKVLQHAAGPPPKGNYLRESYYSRIRDLDPAACGDTMSAIIQGYVFEGLYTYHYLKRPVEAIPLLADGMPKVSKDGLTWTIKIKKGVKYSRNACFGLDDKGKTKTRTVTAGDFVFAFKRIADFHLNSRLAMAFVDDKIVGIKEYRRKTSTYAPGDFSRYDKEKLEGVVALDAHTLQIKINQITPHFLHFLTMTQYAPFPREVVEYYLAREQYPDGSRGNIPIREQRTTIARAEEMVGTGPYVLAKHIPYDSITFVRNPDFREQRYPSQGSAGDRAAGLLADAGKRLPFIDRIEMEYVPNVDLRWRAFNCGQLWHTVIPFEQSAKVMGPNLKLTAEYKARGVRLTKPQSPTVNWIAINMEDPILGKSKSLRQAMSLCIDVEGYIKTVWDGRGKPATNCLSSAIPGHSKVEASPYAKFDLATAKKKLITAKKELAAAGVLKNGQIPTLTLEMAGRDSVSVTIAEFMQKQFAAIGLKVDIKLNDWPTLMAKQNEGKAQMFCMGWHADYPDPENFLQLYYSPNIKATTNTTRYSNPIYDDLFRKFSALPYGPARDKLCKKLVNIISEDCPVLLLGEPVSAIVHHRWIRNFKPHPFRYGTTKYLRIDTKARTTDHKKRKQNQSHSPTTAPSVQNDG